MLDEMTSGETLQNMPYFSNTKIYVVFFNLLLVLELTQNEKRKKLCVFSFSKTIANFEAKTANT